MSFTLKTLTEGIRDRHVGQQNKRLVEKWSRTGLLRGMDDVNREVMATLLENQAAQVLRESNSMGNSNVGGFTNIAFPIVRRVFGGLIANELVSIQPMSLPSGLLFYLDYTYGSANGPHSTDESIYGGPAGKAIQSGALATGGQYDLVGSGFSRVQTEVASTINLIPVNGTHDLIGAPVAGVFGEGEVVNQVINTSDADHLKLIQFDPQLVDRIDNHGEKYMFVGVDLSNALYNDIDLTLHKTFSIKALLKDIGGAAISLALDASVQGQAASHNIMRLNQIGTFGADGKFVADSLAERISGKAVGVAGNVVLLTVVRYSGTVTLGAGGIDGLQTSFPKADSNTFGTDGMVLGDPAFESNLPADGTAHTPTIPEIDIKIESIPVTAQTRKLRARWSPELAQDLNAYHSMDAEVELTQILSEQIALEIDREILGDLLTGAKGANFYWSRSPGKFVNKKTGAEIARTSTLNPGPAFTGTVREWYETLTETVIDVANEIHRKTLRGSANFIVVSPDVATVLEASVLYRPSYSLDGDGQVGAPFTMGAEKMGTLSNRFTVYKDPYFPRNKILVGYKGGSYLETGFVYAPYVPLIVTPTIFQPDDFTPRKGVMTRYGKKMVRADFYGTVTCLDMNII